MLGNASFVISLCSLGFCNTTHEKNVHRMNHGTSVVLLAGQVDDFALGCVDDSTARGIMTLISERIQLPSEAKIPIMFQGVLTSFNGYGVTPNSRLHSTLC